MGNIVPLQSRTVDPFTEYSSNVINSLTKAITGDKNCIFATDALNVKQISDTVLQVSKGVAFISDVVIHIEEDFAIDMLDQDFYVPDTPGGAKPPPMDTTGLYYVVLTYQYAKTKPPPVAYYSILKPHQKAYLSDPKYLLLKVVEVDFVSGEHKISNLYDTDPFDLSVTRIYSPTFIEFLPSLPTFEKSKHEGKIVFSATDKKFYQGGETAWESVGGIGDDGNLGEVWGGKLKSQRFKNTENDPSPSNMEGMIIDLDSEFIKLGGGNDPNRYSLWWNKNGSGDLHFGSGAIKWDNLDDTSKLQLSTEIKVIYNPSPVLPPLPSNPPGLVNEEGDLDNGWTFSPVGAIWSSLATRNGVLWSDWADPFKLSGGENSFTVLFTNPTHNIPVNYDGTLKPNSLTDATTDIIVYYGTKEYSYNDNLTAQYTYKILHSNGTIAGFNATATLDTSTGKIICTDITADSATIPITIQTQDGLILGPFNWALKKVYDGKDGASKLISISSLEGLVFKHDSDTTLSYPTDGKITLKAYVYNLNVSDIEWQYWDPTANGGLGDWSATFASGVDVIEIDGTNDTAPNFSSGVRTFRVLVNDPLEGEITDTISLSHITDGLQGPTGTANYIVLTADNIVFKYDVDGNISNPTIRLTATKYNISEFDYKWYFWDVNSSSWIHITGNDNQTQFVVTHTDFTEDFRTYKVTVGEGVGQPKEDIITLYKVYDARGNKTVGLTNPSNGISCDYLGNPLPGAFVGAYTEFVVYYNGQKLNWETYSGSLPSPGYFTINDSTGIVETGIDVSLDTGTGKLSLIDIIQDNGWADISIIFPDGEEIITTFTAYKSYAGQNSYTVSLSNESHTIETDPIGVPKPGEVGINSPAKTLVKAYDGDVELNYTLNDTPSTGEFSIKNIRFVEGTGNGWSVFEDTTSGGIYVNSITTNSDDNASILFDIIFADGRVLTKQFSVNKSKGRGYVNVIADALTIRYDENGNLDGPTQIELTAEPHNIESPTYKWYVKYDEGTFNLLPDTDELVYFNAPATISDTFSTIATFKVEVYDNNNPTILLDTDTVTINKFQNIRGRDGIGTYSIILTNESHSVLCDSIGNPETGEIGPSGRAQTRVIVQYDATELVYTSSATPAVGEFTIDVSSSGFESGGNGWTVDFIGDTVYVSDLTLDADNAGSFKILVKTSDGSIFPKIWSLDRKIGTGTIEINGDSYVIVYNDSGGLKYPNSINFNAVVKGVNAPYIKWYVKYDNNSTYTLLIDAGNGTSWTYNSPSTILADFAEKATFKAELYDPFDISRLIDEDTFTISKIQEVKGPQGDPGQDGIDGQDSYGVIIDNESHTISCDSDGIPLSGQIGLGSPATTNVFAFLGNTELTYSGDDTPTPGTFSIKNIRTSDSTGWSFKEDLGNGAVYVDAVGTADSAVCDFDIYFSDGTTITKRFSVDKAKGIGSVTLTASKYLIHYNTDGYIYPVDNNNIDITYSSQGITNPTFKLYQKFDDGAFSKVYEGTSTTYTLATTSFSTFTSSIHFKVEAYENDTGTLIDIDEITISKVFDGERGIAEDSYSVFMTNESHTVPAQSNGSVINYDGASTFIKVLKGQNELSYKNSTNPGQTFFGITSSDILSVNGTFELNTTTGEIKCTNINAAKDVAYADVSIHLEDSGRVIKKRFTVSKSKKGADGSEPKILRLAAGSNIFEYSSPTDASASPSYINITVQRNFTGTINWLYSRDGGIVWNQIKLTSGANYSGSRLQVYPNGTYNSINWSSIWGSYKNISFKAVSGGVEDSVSVVKVYGGVAGKDAYSVSLDNPTHTILVDKSGNVLSGELNLANTIVNVYHGGAKLTYGTHYTIGTLSSSNSGWSFSKSANLVSLQSVSATASDTVKCTIPVSINSGPTINAVFTLNKVRSDTAIDLSLNSHVVKYSASGAKTPTSINVSWAIRGTTPNSPQYRLTISKDGGSESQLYSGTNTSYTLNNTHLNFTNYAKIKVYLYSNGSTSSSNLVTTDEASIVVSRDGAIGEDAYTVVLTNEAHTVPANSAGTVLSLTDAYTDVLVFLGSTQLTYVNNSSPGPGQFYVGSPTNQTSGYNFSRNPTNGRISLVSISSSSDTGSCTIPIKLPNGKTINKKFSITRVRRGATGSQGPPGSQGPSGADAVYVKITANDQIFKYAAGASTPTPSSTTITATKYGPGSATYQWQYRRPGGSWYNISGATSQSYSLSHNSTLWGSYKTLSIRVRMTVAGKNYYDSMTFAKVYDGAKGDRGAPGTDGAFIEINSSNGIFFVKKAGFSGSATSHYNYSYTTITIKTNGEQVSVTTTGLNSNYSNTTKNNGFNFRIYPVSYGSYKYMTGTDAKITVTGKSSGITKTLVIKKLDEVRGTYIDQNGIYTGNITANQINTGTLDASRINVTNLDAGSITTGILRAGSGNSNFDLDNSILNLFNDGQMVSWNGSSESNSLEKSVLSAGSLKFLYRTSTSSTTWNIRNYVSRIEVGIAGDGDTVTFNPPFKTFPKLILSIAKAKVYDSRESNRTQTIRLKAENFSIHGFKPRMYHIIYGDPLIEKAEYNIKINAPEYATGNLNEWQLERTTNTKTSKVHVNLEIIRGRTSIDNNGNIVSDLYEWHIYLGDDSRGTQVTLNLTGTHSYLEVFKSISIRTFRKLIIRVVKGAYLGSKTFVGYDLPSSVFEPDISYSGPDGVIYEESVRRPLVEEYDVLPGMTSDINWIAIGN